MPIAGPWQYETLAREVLLDIAARKIGIDPVELRRRNILRGDEMPYFNPNGMPYDHVAPSDTVEQAVKILDHDGLPQGTGRGPGAGPLPRPWLLGVRRTDRCGDGSPGHRGRHHAHGVDRQDQRLRQRRVDRKQPRDHGRSAHGRCAGRRHRRRRDHPGRHRGHPVRCGHAGQSQRADDRGSGQRGGHDPAQPDRRNGRPPARCRTVRHRAGQVDGGGAGRPDEERHLRRPGLPRATTTRPSCRRARRPRWSRPHASPHRQ